MRLIALAFALVLAQGQEPLKVDKPTPFTVRLQHCFPKPLAGAWQPYVLEVTNGLGRDVEALIRLEDEGTQTAVTRRETVTKGASKRIFLHLPLGSLGAYPQMLQPRVTVSEAGGRLLAPVAKAFAPQGNSDPKDFHLGLLSGDKGSDDDFHFPRQFSGAAVQLARLTPSTLPDRWVGLAGLDLLVLHDAPLDELTTAQQQAIADYVRQGGTVALSPGATRNWLGHPALAQFVKIKPGPTSERTGLPVLEALHGRFASRERFLFHAIENGKPFSRAIDDRSLLTFEAGFGRVFALPFDLRRAPFEGWSGLTGLWTSILGETPRRFRRDHETETSLGGDPVSRMNFYRSMMSQINTYPPFLLLVALSAVFLTVVGPLNYLALRRLGMSLLVVVTVPVLSLGFLGVVLGIGYILKGTSTVTFSVRLLSAESGGDCARETHLFTLFSPSTRTYEVSLGAGTYAFPTGRVGREDENYGINYWRGREAAERVEMDQSAIFRFRNVGVGQWETWNAEGRALRDLGGGVTFQAAGGGLRITNGSPCTIARGLYCSVGRGGYASPFGEVAPGQTLELPLDPNSWNPVADLGFAPGSFQALLLEPQFARMRNLQQASDVRKQQTFLLCLVKEAKPAVEIDARSSGQSASLTLLQVRGEGR